MNTEELTVMEKKLDAMQDELINNRNRINETLEICESYLIWVGKEIEKLSKPVEEYER